MKVQVISQKGYINAIGKVMELEGDEVVFSKTPLDKDKFDLILTDTKVPSSGIPTITFGDEIPSTILSGLGIETEKGETSFIVMKWFDEFNGWGSQTSIGIPLNTLMNNNLGPKCLTGLCLRYVSEDSCPKLLHFFHKKSLVEFLKKLNHTGFVSAECVFTQSDVDLKSIRTGLLRPAIFATLEGVKCPLSEFFAEPNYLMESWASSILVSRFPFPAEGQTDERTRIEGIDKEVIKHFWMPFVGNHKKSFFTQSTIIGFATAWSHKLYSSNQRALRTCRAIKVLDQQYRTDLDLIGQKCWASILDRGLVVRGVQVES